MNKKWDNNTVIRILPNRSSRWRKKCSGGERKRRQINWVQHFVFQTTVMRLKNQISIHEFWKSKIINELLVLMKNKSAWIFLELPDIFWEERDFPCFIFLVLFREWLNLTVIGRFLDFETDIEGGKLRRLACLPRERFTRMHFSRYFS